MNLERRVQKMKIVTYGGKMYTKKNNIIVTKYTVFRNMTSKRSQNVRRRILTLIILQ